MMRPKESLAPDDLLAGEWRKRAELLFHWYREDLARGLRPEIARDILPNLLKSEIFVSGRWSGWKHFILLRDSARRTRGFAFSQKVSENISKGSGLSADAI